MNIIKYNIQELNNSKACVLVSLTQVASISKIDAQTVASDTALYCRENKFSYYVLLNTWGNLILSESSEEAWYYIWLHMQEFGLISCIRDCSKLADLIISGELPDWDYVYGYLGCLAGNYSECQDKLATVLEVLRFPKRFSPLHADKIISNSINDFLAVNREVKRVQHVEFPQYWISRVRDRVADMIKGFDQLFDPELGKFSNGTTASRSTVLIDKLLDIKKREPNFYRSPLYPIASRDPRVDALWCGTNRPNLAVRLTAVPKTYKSARIIAMEPTHNGFALQAAMDSLRRAVRQNGYLQFADTSDQLVSHELCRLGSIDGSYATIDLSMASDRIAESLIRSVFPEVFLHAVDPYRATQILIDKKDRSGQTTMHMFATSGSPLTFDVQTILFSAIAQEVTALVSLFSGEQLLPPRQFGDDAIVDGRAADLFMAVLIQFGAKPNMDKSFTGMSNIGYYRESCGVEYLNGRAMHGMYYPRSVVRLNDDGVAAVCALQHRTYHCWKARLFLTELVKKLQPQMTAHRFGSDCSDLWDVIDRTEVVQYKGVDHPAAMRHKHSVLVSKYPTQKSEEYQAIRKDNFDLLDLWYYTQYLVYGPQYESELDKLLRVSKPRKSYASDLFKSESVWRTVLE